MQAPARTYTQLRAAYGIPARHSAGTTEAGYRRTEPGDYAERTATPR